MHAIAAKAVAFKEALAPEFKEYQNQIVKNAKHLGECMLENGFNLVSGGTDNHLVLIDLRDTEITGKIAEDTLELAGITANKNAIPFDPLPPAVTSGIRIGTPAITTRGMKEEQMEVISGFIKEALDNIENESTLSRIKNDVRELCKQFPMYSERLV